MYNIVEFEQERWEGKTKLQMTRYLHPQIHVLILNLTVFGDRPLRGNKDGDLMSWISALVNETSCASSIRQVHSEKKPSVNQSPVLLAP